MRLQAEFARRRARSGRARRRGFMGGGKIGKSGKLEAE
jgi:hypothetical protein